MKLLHSLKKTKELANLYIFAYRVLQEGSPYHDYPAIDEIKQKAENIIDSVNKELAKYKSFIGKNALIPKEMIPSDFWSSAQKQDIPVVIKAIWGFSTTGEVTVKVQNKEGLSDIVSLQKLK